MKMTIISANMIAEVRLCIVQLSCDFLWTRRRKNKTNKEGTMLVYSVCVVYILSRVENWEYLHGTGFSVYLLTSKEESCDEEDGEVGESVVEEELA